ncbi:hypothetical protein KRP22_011668 [Phytophthora ramorum]|nr:hypothetical protein KRP22_11502 [Phytophthora ramorum]
MGEDASSSLGSISRQHVRKLVFEAIAKVLNSCGSDSSTTTSSSSGTSTASKKKKKTSTSSSSGTGSVTSDPTSAKFTLSAFAIGDWGTTVTQDSCCTRSSTFNDYDVNAEDIVASIMDTQASAASAPPKCILSHGDNFYWTGIDSEVPHGG